MNSNHGGPPREEQAGSSEALEVVLAHARLQWEAEVENARRMSTRSTSLVTLLVALVGLGLMRLGNPGPTWPGGLRTIGQLLLLASLCAFMGALGVLLAVGSLRTRPGNGWPLASCLLRWPVETGLDSLQVTPKQARRVTIRALFDAVSSLQGRNTRRKQEIDRAQIWLLVSGALAAVSLVAYSLAE